MYSIFVETKYGDKLELTHSEAYTIESTDGFDPPDAVINTTEGAGSDGSTFNSSRLENRTITLTLVLNEPVLENRLALYRYFSPKQYVKLTYITEARSMYAEGYVQTMPIDFYAKKEVVQITVVCPNPFLINTVDSVTNFSYVEALFEFPFTIEAEGVVMSELHTVQEEIVLNDGELEAGALIELHALGAVVNPVVTYADTGEHIALTLSMSAGDTVTINTRKNHKGVTLTHNGVTTSVVGYMSSDSVFFQLRAGECAIVVDATSGASYIETTVTVEGLFAGV